LELDPRNVKIKICKTIILLVFCDCEIWSLKMWEEHGLRVFENRMMGILEPERDEIT
jgi:hypothetical protein